MTVKTLNFKNGQWAYLVTLSDEQYVKLLAGELDIDMASMEGFNLQDGVRAFYALVLGKYGQPLFIVEPDRAFECPSDLVYVDKLDKSATPEQKIAGIVCDGALRASLTNARKQGKPVAPNADGSIQVGDEVWWIATLFVKDKNRIFGYDAYLVRERPEQVRVLELGDLDLFKK